MLHGLSARPHLEGGPTTAAKPGTVLASLTYSAAFTAHLAGAVNRVGG